MLSLKRLAAVALATVTLGLPSLVSANAVPLGELGRFQGWQDNALTGYGLVVGLSGSGDSRRSGVTQQALRNLYNRAGLTVTEDDIANRNVALVTVTATLPPSANVGDKISVTVSTMADARSLAGGQLIATPLVAGNQDVYALAQGALTAGGYAFESEGNYVQKNFPTTARIEGGAKVVRDVDAKLVGRDGRMSFLLNEPDFVTADRAMQAINRRFGNETAYAASADEIVIDYIGGPRDMVRFISIIQTLDIEPQRASRIVINERTGTVVAGSDVRINSVVISQGDVQVTVRAENFASQPGFISGINPNVASLIVRNTELDVDERETDVVATFDNTTVSDLVEGLNRAGVNTRGIIDVLQSMKQAGAIQAEIVVQ